MSTRARLRSQGASSWGAFGGQKVRYEAGRMAAARAYVPRLLRRAIRHRDAACLEAAWFLASPPFALGALSLLARRRARRDRRRLDGRGRLRRRVRSLLALALVIGLIQARAGLAHVARAARRALVPGLEGRRPARALASLLRRDDYYAPTARA